MRPEEFLATLDHVKAVGPDEWKARCPAHEDTSRDSLSIRATDDRLLVKDFGGCTVAAVMAARGLTLRDLFFSTNGQGPRREKTAYDYLDHEGEVRYQTVRYEPKDFRQRRPDGAGGWIWNLHGVARVLYRLPDLLDARRVFWVEGEKDADALAAGKLVATTTCGGALAFGKSDYAAQLKRAAPEAEVVLLRDNDPAGLRYRDERAAACHAAGLVVRVLDLDVAEKGDVSDWLAAGHTAAELTALADAAPIWTPGAVDESELFAEAPEAWPALVPIPTDLAPVPAFALDLLPEALRPWVGDIAERVQCPPDYVAVTAMVALAAVVGRQCGVKPKRFDDWLVVPNLWGLVIGPPGIMKSPAFTETLRPLFYLVARAREAHAAALEAYEFDTVAAEAKRDDLKKQIKRAVAAGGTGDDLRAAFAACTVEPPTERRYLVNDATVEKLGALLNENPNGLLHFRDEQSGWLHTLDREGHENDRAFFCEAWNGTGGYTYDRIERGTIHIATCCLSLLGGIQPGPLAAYLREVFGDGSRNDGLSQRFQLQVYPDIVAAWHNVDRWPDTAARTRVRDLFVALSAFDPDAVGAHVEDEGPPFLHFLPEAQARFDAWREGLEVRLRAGHEHPVLLGHLAKYRSLAPSLALLDHLVDCVDHGRGGPISEAAMARAEAWVGYLEPHARRVYATVTSGGREAAAHLAAKLRSLPVPFTARTVQLKGWAGLTTPETVEAALDALEEWHWVRAERIGTTRRGGRPTYGYHVNPRVPQDSA